MTNEAVKMITLPFEEYNELIAVSKRYDSLSGNFWEKVEEAVKKMEVQVNKEIKEYRSHLKTYYKANMNNYPELEEKYNKLDEECKTIKDEYDALKIVTETLTKDYCHSLQNINEMIDKDNFYLNVYKYSTIVLLLVILVPYIWTFVDMLYEFLIK